MKRYTFAVVAFLLGLAPWHQSLRAEPAHYTVVNLGTLGGLVPTITGINASGQVAGYVQGPAGLRAVRYTDGPGWQYLPGLEDSYSQANGINAAGDVVGYRFTAAGARAFRYHDGAPVEDIAPLPGGSFTQGFAINDAGAVVGYADSADGIVGFLANPNSRPVALPSLGGGFTVACGINAAGQVAGSSATPSGAQHAVRIDPNSPVPLEIVPFTGAAGSNAACAIDANGRVGGQSDTVDGKAHAFRFTGGAPVDLDTFGSGSSNVESISDGTSVGWYTPGTTNTSLAFVHTDADGTIDLNSVLDDGAGWILSLAKAVNAKGAIAGEGTFNGSPAVFRLARVDAAPIDTTAPVFTSLTATPSTIFPPKGQTVSVAVAASATDDSGVAPVCTLASISGPGTSPDDFNVTGANSGTVRAIGGRSYTFNETCVDGANNAAFSSVTVTVPADTTAPVISRVSASPSTIALPNAALVPVSLTVDATDDVDDAPVCTLTSISSSAQTADGFAITGALTAKVRAVGGRTYTLNVRCSDAAGNGSDAATSVVVLRDTSAPKILAVSATPSAVWPPNGKWVAVAVSVFATDNVDASPSCALSSISGAAAGDYVITGPFTASVRAEKNSDASTRVYRLNITCSDRAGNSATDTATVTVTKDAPAPVKGTMKK